MKLIKIDLQLTVLGLLIIGLTSCGPSKEELAHVADLQASIEAAEAEFNRTEKEVADRRKANDELERKAAELHGQLRGLEDNADEQERVNQAVEKLRETLAEVKASQKAIEEAMSSLPKS
ncbi:hypothetical protein [Sulfuriroseicoccus oceanibius]|uniref:Uncharacterized protein n=1 Tax=Sulfuriroseicoccus oceanibius TaxID=2707525 RepID=A0A6B3L5S5_9BACT|nr:hypothetical protein [Sulfuriroseicoccus oceanibius]QQL45108.1 hypothetical protein G3M56_000530 [Sulfuriroseicoccus oceanibius]